MNRYQYRRFHNPIRLDVLDEPIDAKKTVELVKHMIDKMGIKIVLNESFLKEEAYIILFNKKLKSFDPYFKNFHVVRYCFDYLGKKYFKTYDYAVPLAFILYMAKEIFPDSMHFFKIVETIKDENGKLKKKVMDTEDLYECDEVVFFWDKNKHNFIEFPDIEKIRIKYEKYSEPYIKELHRMIYEYKKENLFVPTKNNEYISLTIY